MPFVKMKDNDGNVISVNSDYIDKYTKQGYTTDLNKPLDYNKLSKNSIYRKENDDLVGDAYVPQQTFTNGMTLGQSNVQREIDKLAKLQSEQAIAGLEKAKNSQLSNLSAEKATIKPMYYNSRNQTATASQLGAKSFAEYMASRGLTNSGASMQGEINRVGTLQNNINSLNVAENQAYADNARRVSDVKNAYESDLASAEAGIQATALQNKIAEMQRQQDIQREDARYNDELARQDETTAYNRSQDAFQREIDTLGGYYENYQAEINRRMATPDKSDDALIPYLQTARQQKIQELAEIERQQQSAEATARSKAEQQQFENNLKQKQYELDLMKAKYDTSKPYYKPATSNPNTTTSYKNSPDFAADLQRIYSDPVRALQQLQSNATTFIQTYGLDGYNALVKEARANIQE